MTTETHSGIYYVLLYHIVVFVCVSFTVIFTPIS